MKRVRLFISNIRLCRNEWVDARYYNNLIWLLLILLCAYTSLHLHRSLPQSCASKCLCLRLYVSQVVSIGESLNLEWWNPFDTAYTTTSYDVLPAPFSIVIHQLQSELYALVEKSVHAFSVGLFFSFTAVESQKQIEKCTRGANMV